MKAKTVLSTKEESAIIERLGRIVSSVHGGKPDYTRLATELEEAIPFDIFGVVLLRHDREAVRVTVCEREGDGWRVQYHQHPRKDSHLERLLHNPQLTVTEYVSELDGAPGETGDALSQYHHMRSTLIAPLQVEGHVLGSLELGSSRAGTYADEALQRLVSAVAHVLASAIESAQRKGSVEIQDRQRQALKDVSSALTSKMELSTIFTQIVMGIASALDVASMIIMVDQREQRWHVEAHSGIDGEGIARLFELRPRIQEQCIVGCTLLSRQPCITQDILTDSRFTANREIFQLLGVHSVCCYPLATGTTVYGVLLLCSKTTEGFTPLKIDILSLFASQATVAIHNGMVFESTRRRRNFQAVLERYEHAQQRAAWVVDDGQEEDESALFARVREETQRAFGISFSSLLRFISDYLLTPEERNLQELLPAQLHAQGVVETHDSMQPVDESVAGGHENKDPFARVLTETTEMALVRAEMLGELGRLLVQLEQSANSLRDPWFVIDLHGYCVYMNPSAEKFCGLRLEEVKVSTQEHGRVGGTTHEGGIGIEQLFASLQPRMRNAEEVAAYLHSFRHGTPIYGQEVCCVLAPEPLVEPGNEALGGQIVASVKEGMPADYYYQCTRYPLHTQQGYLLANALQVRNITEQVRDEKNRSVLLSMVSHDLRTPLTTIKAAVTGLLQEDVAWEEQDRRAMLEDIDCEADHLTVLVNALVDLSRIEMGALVLQKEWCDLIEVMNGMLSRSKRIVSGHVLTTHVQKALPLVYIDHVQIERVLYNLVENAVRRSPEGGEIVLCLDKVDEVYGAKMVRVGVIDRGESIPEEERAHMFESFARLRSYGNGLSLAICKGIVEAHHGQMQVTNMERGGTGFVFTIPIQGVASAYTREHME